MSMKMKKLALALVVILMASALTPAFAKSPFADVPADHWAYDSIVELAAAGLIEGYPDGTFGGARMMTRYEAAMVFARALARIETRLDVLPELDRIKAELVEEIQAQLAAVDVPVETVVERVIVDKDVDADALARIRANEIAVEALEGDIAYVEARTLGLIDGIRFDLNALQELGDVEVPSLEEIEALIAEKIEEGLLQAAESALEPTVIERVVVMEAELTEEEVELIARAMIVQQLQKYELMIVGALQDIAKLDSRVSALEEAQAGLASKEELDAVKEDVSGVQAAVEALEKVKLGGSLSLTGKYESGGPYTFSQSIGLNLKISDSTSVSATASLPAEQFGSLGTYRVAVTSDTPIKSLTVGKWAGGPDVVGIGNDYVLPNSAYRFAGVANLDLFEGLGATVLLGEKAEGDPVTAGLALSYDLVPELGVKLAVAGEKAAAVAPEALAVGGGVSGALGGFSYGGDFAMDLGAESDNTIFKVSLGADIGPLSLDGSYLNKSVNYGIVNPLVKGSAAGDAIEAGLGTDFLLGIDLGARFYRETDADAEDPVITAYQLTAAKELDLGLPIAVSAAFAQNKQAETRKHASANVGFGPIEAGGLKFGGGFGFAKNEYNAGGNWKNGNISERDVATINGSVDYGFDWGGADVGLGYALNLRVPVKPEGANTLTHDLSVGYTFSSNVKLTLGGKVVQTLGEAPSNAFNYNAGLTISF